MVVRATSGGIDPRICEYLPTDKAAILGHEPMMPSTPAPTL
jgi:hypothetical protein